MIQRAKRQPYVSRTQSAPQLKDIQKSLQQSFSILVLECGSFCRQMKQLLSDKLKIDIHQGWQSDHIETPTIKQFKDITILMNQDLKSILSLTKILLSTKTSLTGLDSNQYRVLKSCVALNELAGTLDQLFISSEICNQYKPDLMNLVKSLSDNLYTYQSSNTEFNDLIKEFVTRSPSINLTIPSNSMKSSRASQRNMSIGSNSNGANDKDIMLLKRLISEKEIEAEKNNEQFSICIEEYNRYIYQLKDQISSLTEQLLLIEKDREELKQHNIILLKNTGVLPQKINSSRMSMRNVSRRATVTDFDERQRGSLKMSEAPAYRVSHQSNPSDTSFLSMTRLLNGTDRK